MAVYAYNRVIEIGNDTDGFIEFQSRAKACSFNFKQRKGCDSCSITLPSEPFNSYAGIRFGDTIKLSYKSGVLWWTGIVEDLRTSLRNGLSVKGLGFFHSSLKETRVSERYGSDVGITPVTSILSVEEDGGNLGQGNHSYYVSAFDELGERVPGPTAGPVDWTSSFAAVAVDLTTYPGSLTTTKRKLTLSWAESAGASYYRVYKAWYEDLVGEDAGAGSASIVPGDAPTKFYYVDIADIFFVDDGTLDWENEGTEIAALPTVVTSIVVSIDDTTLDSDAVSFGTGFDVNSAVRHLVDTYYNDGYDITKLTAAIGATDYTLDEVYFDDGEVSLADALQTLADIAGGIAWGVDGNGDVYFVKRGDPWADDYADSVVKEWNVGNQFSSAEANVVDPAVVDILTDATRSASRDGITQIAMVPDKRGSKNLFAKGPVKRVNNPSGSGGSDEDWNFGDGVEDILHASNDPRIVSTRLAPTSPTIPADVGTGGAIFFSSYADVEAFEVDFPGMGWLFRHKDDLPDAIIEAWLATLRDRVQPAYAQVRVRSLHASLKGIRTLKTSSRASANVALDYVPVNGRWDIRIIKNELLFVPGQDLVALSDVSEEQYVMSVQDVKVSFGDTVETALTCGEPDAAERAEEDQYKILEGVVLRGDSMDGTMTGLHSPIVHEIRQTPLPVTIGRGVIGTSPVPASANHQHAMGLPEVNALISDDGNTFPHMGRRFVIADATARTALLSSVRGLIFKALDLSVFTDTDEIEIYNGSAWVPVGGAWVSYTAP